LPTDEICWTTPDPLVYSKPPFVRYFAVVSVPSLPIVNLVAPLALAVKMSPLFFWLIIAAALTPMPPETESGAIVLDDEPMRTPD